MMVSDYGALAKELALSCGKISRILLTRHGRKVNRSTVRTILTGEGHSFFSQELKQLVFQIVEQEAANRYKYLERLMGA